MSSEPILIFRMGSLGDFVVSLPCFHLIERKYPDSARILMTNNPVHAKAPLASSVFGDSGLVHRYLRYPAKTRNPWALAKLSWQIRRTGARTLIYLAQSRGQRALRRDVIFFRLSGIRRFIGLPERDLENNLAIGNSGLYESEAHRLGRCLKPLGNLDLDDPNNWDLRLNSVEVERAKQILQSLKGTALLAVAIASKAQAKDWGVENWRALMPMLRTAFPNHGMIFVGAKEDAESSETVLKDFRGPGLNLCGRLTPRETAAVIKDCDIFLGVDSGPMHLAAAVKVSCVIPFAARTLPGMWFPQGKGHQILYNKTDCFNCGLEICIEQRRKCLLSIGPAEVAEAAIRAKERQSQIETGLIGLS